MSISAKNLRVCDKGHKYYKSSSCPICPICAKESSYDHEFLSIISAPARRALENAGITTVEKLAKVSESDLLRLHGMGPSSVPKLRGVLTSHGLSFKIK